MEASLPRYKGRMFPSSSNGDVPLLHSLVYFFFKQPFAQHNTAKHLLLIRCCMVTLTATCKTVIFLFFFFAFKDLLTCVGMLVCVVLVLQYVDRTMSISRTDMLCFCDKLAFCQIWFSVKRWGAELGYVFF